MERLKAADHEPGPRLVEYVAPLGLSTRRRVYRMEKVSILWFIFLVNAVAIVVLWWRGGNVSGVHDLGQALSSLGRITGLISAYLILVQVLLLARLRWLEQSTGFDRLTVWHRINGKVCLYLVLAHVVFITVGYALTDRISVLSEAWTLLTGYPGMVEATIGTALMIVVVLTSLVIVRRRMRYEAWYFVHFTVYAAILLGWFHQVPTGNEFITNPAATRYWTGLYLATLALVVLFRFLHPSLRQAWHRLRVDEVMVESPGVVSLRISGRHLDGFKPRAGQFFLWRFLSQGRWWEAHPFSLSEAPDGRSFRITVKDSGDFTHHLRELKPGTAVMAEGPFGVFTDETRRREGVVLIAGGIGITPIRALVEDMSGDMTLIYRAMRDSEIVFRDELERIARYRSLELHYVVGDHAAPGNERLMSPDHLRELVPDIADRDVYLCGPPAMMNVLERNVRAAGVPRKFIHTERFAL